MEVLNVKEVSQQTALERITQFMQDASVMAHVQSDVAAQLQLLEAALKKHQIVLPTDKLPADERFGRKKESMDTSPTTPERPDKKKSSKKRPKEEDSASTPPATPDSKKKSKKSKSTPKSEKKEKRKSSGGKKSK